MPASAICPSCGTASTYRRLPATTCPRCGKELPPDLVQQLETSVLQEGVPTPALLLLGTYGALVLGAFGLLLAVLAPFNIGNYSIDGRSVSGPEFLRQVGVFWVTVFALTLCIGYLLWSKRPWIRPLLVLYWVVMAAGILIIPTAGGLAVRLQGVVFLLVFTFVPSILYLYVKSSVVAYFDWLAARRERTRASGGGPLPRRGA